MEVFRRFIMSVFPIIFIFYLSNNCSVKFTASVDGILGKRFLTPKKMNLHLSGRLTCSILFIKYIVLFNNYSYLCIVRSLSNYVRCASVMR